MCYVVDRLKELIKVQGYQVAPAELEALLQGMPVGKAKASSFFLVFKTMSRFAKTGSGQTQEEIVEKERLVSFFFVQGVGDCAVIGIPHERSGEVPKAFIVRAGGDAGAALTAVRKRWFLCPLFIVL